MGNRIMKESITTSEKLAKLSHFEFSLWVGLVTQADDYGCGDARAAIVRNFVFPLLEDVTVKDVEQAIKRLEKVGCIRIYKAEGMPYFWFPNWLEHQRLRNHKPKFPQPPELEAVIARRRAETAAASEKRKKAGRDKPYDYEPAYEGFEEPEEAPVSEEPVPEEAASDESVPEKTPVTAEERMYAAFDARECREQLESYESFGMKPPEALARRARSLGLYLRNTG